MMMAISASLGPGSCSSLIGTELRLSRNSIMGDVMRVSRTFLWAEASGNGRFERRIGAGKALKLPSAWASTQAMSVTLSRLSPLLALVVAISFGMAQLAGAQEEDVLGSDPLESLDLPDLSEYAPASPGNQLAIAATGEITLSAQLTEDGEEITRGLVWRVFKPEPAADGKLPLVASAHGGKASFQLEPGSYLVHAAYGRGGATKRITVRREPRRENIVLDAGGLKLDAVLAGGQHISPKKLRFSIYERGTEPDGDQALIIPNVKPNTVVRLNAGIYHVVSTYGATNAVIRSDIRVEAGKLTEATIEHHAAEVTMKLVREPGGEAIADTSWSVLNESGDPIKEAVGAYAPMVLAEGAYT